ncbi:protein SOSEKI 5 isoform X2 [Elaeis guineensis]|uniref:Protein UPSTREAM OF FLC isoform X2 n=1 Tax=Elaeis guineensis var. tenera TaxID=51953 RepID=A0A6I9S636_ELAGV|nr:protein UPSTREAM OF FLC isoform X2 [Elaeis guineensis]
MAVASRGRAELVKQWKDRETSPERTKVWTEPKSRSSPRKVPVVYYLSRNGQLEHPHFMEVSLSSSDGLYLKDVIDRLNFLRGKGMASMYSWSSKRSYKNGFVWHDLSEDDFIYPTHGHEYVLKGSELLLPADSSPTSQDTAASSSSNSEKPLAIPKSVHDDSDYSLVRRNKTPWSSLDLNEYKVYKTELTAETALKAADAATQTDEKRQRRRGVVVRDEVPRAAEENPTTELGRDEISPPPSSSSPETLETLIKADGRVVPVAPSDADRTVDSYPSGKLRASAVLMHLISCGSIPMKEHGFSSLVSHYRGRLPRGRSDMSARVEMDGLIENPSFPAIRMEDKEYFSGSLIETKKKESDGVAEFPGLKRSSSYNADRSSKLELAEKEIEGVRAKCIPRKPRATARKETIPPISGSNHGSRRINDEPPPK